MSDPPEWLIIYEHPNEGQLLAVKVDDIISFNDGDVCNAACTQNILHMAEAEAEANHPRSLICVDIGVDKGWWSTFCLKQSPSVHVYAFEPNPISFQALQTRFANESRITLVPKAVSDSVKTIPLQIDGGCSHSREHLEKEEEDCSTVAVETTTLDFIFETHSHIDCMKIDTEGHEWTIFQALAPHFSKVGAIIFEFTTYWYGASKIECLSRSYEMLLKILEDFPYVYTLSRRGMPMPRRIATQEDALNYVHFCYDNRYQTDILASHLPPGQ